MSLTPRSIPNVSLIERIESFSPSIDFIRLSIATVIPLSRLSFRIGRPYSVKSIFARDPTSLRVILSTIILGFAKTSPIGIL